MTSLSVIVGPTASGKSAHALALAQEVSGVILNADSLQLYAGLPRLTAQPTAEDQTLVPHRLYGVFHPNTPVSAGLWCRTVIPEIRGILETGRVPILCGGTGFYIKALIEGLSPIPDIPPAFRAQAVAEQKLLGNPAFHRALALKDPETAQSLDPYNTARLVRAWEVLAFTGRPLASWQSLPKTPLAPDWHFTVHKIMPARDLLYERCRSRFMEMIRLGVLEEVAAFSDRIGKGEIDPQAPLTQALGFKPLAGYLAGTYTKEEAIKKAVTETRHYAKRQMTWFRHQI